jgi:hypothetical protein
LSLLRGMLASTDKIARLHESKLRLTLKISS